MSCAKNVFPGVTRIIAVPITMVVALALSACSFGQAVETSVEPTNEVLASKVATSSAEASATLDTGAVAQTLEVSDEEARPHPLPWGQITDKVAAGAKLLSVDTSGEYAAEHVTGAASVPSGKVDAESEGWDKDAPLVLTSSVEEVARSVAGHLVRNGFTEVYYLAGGHDEWGGTFEGSDAREATVPSKLFYIYITDDPAITVGDYSTEHVLKLSAELADSMKGIADEFDGDVDIEVVNATAQPSRTLELVDMYDVPTMKIDGMEILLTPRWVLVDRDGKVSHFDGMGLNLSASAVYGWCCEQAEAK